MKEIDLSELTYLIQEGHGDRPALLDVLVRRFAPDVFRLAFDVHPENEDRLEDALGLTAETFRRAMADHGKLSEFDSIRNWLFAVLIGLMNRTRREMTGARKSAGPDRLVLILRYGHDLSVDDIGEVVGMHPNAAHRRLRRSRRRAAGLSRPSGRGHIGRAIEDAVDERIAWTEIPNSEHLESCAECRRFLGALQEFGSRFQTELVNARPAGMMAGAVEAILDHLAEGSGVENDRGGRRLPIKEAIWAAGAVGAFLLVFQLLNPVLSIEPPQPSPTPTQLPAEPAASELVPPDYALLENQLAIWEPWLRWQPAETISGVHPATTDITIVRAWPYAAFGSFNDVVLWDLLQGVEIPLKGHVSIVTALAFRGHWLVSGSEDGTVRIWEIGDPTNPKVRYVLEDAPRPVSSLALSDDGRFLAVGGNSGIKIWEFRQDGMREVEHLDGEFVRSLAFSPGAGLTGASIGLLGAVDRSGVLNIWELPEFTHRLRIAIRQRFNTGIAFSNESHMIATASMDGSVKVFRLSETGQNEFSAAHMFTFSHPTWVSDLIWYSDELLMAVAGSHESSISDLGKRGVYFWEMSSGLPAAPPLFLENDGGILNVQRGSGNQLLVGSYNRAVHILELKQPVASGELTHFARAATSLRPFDSSLSSTSEPEPEDDFSLSFSTALDQIGYAQSLLIPLNQGIPPATAPKGASYDAVTGFATFAFTRSFALDHEEWIFLRIRRIDDQDPYPYYEDWVGAGAQVEQIQFGRYIGERVTGEWLPAAVDGSAEGILRWTETPLTRFRWQQDGYLFETYSRSEIGTGDSRWTSLFMPIILALVSADEAGLLIDYTVVEGDTCTDIATRFGTTVGRIVGLNDLTATCVIFAGNTLKLPLPPAFGPMLERDLDCDGVPERLRMIPDPQRDDSELYLGFALEDIPGRDGLTAFDYSTYWTYTIPAVDVDFFEAPILLSVTGGCPWFIAITGYGGTGDDSGLKIFSWEGDAMALILDAAGFLLGDYRFIDDGIEFDTRRLDYDPDTTACTETITSYAWRDGDFVEVSETVTGGVACFSSGP